MRHGDRNRTSDGQAQARRRQEVRQRKRASQRVALHRDGRLEMQCTDGHAAGVHRTAQPHSAIGCIARVAAGCEPRATVGRGRGREVP
jgi:hypothetical protein